MHIRASFFSRSFSSLLFLSPLEVINFPTTIQSTFTCSVGCLRKPPEKANEMIFTQKVKTLLKVSSSTIDRDFWYDTKEGQSELFTAARFTSTSSGSKLIRSSRKVFIGIFFKLSFIYFPLLENIYSLKGLCRLKRGWIAFKCPYCLVVFSINL